MNSKQRIGLAVGGGIIALAAAVGVGAFAANLANGSGDQSGMPGYGQRQGGGGFGNRGGQQFDTSALAKQLATKLGVDESKMKTALDNAFKAAQPSGAPSGGFNGTPGAMPTGGMPSGAMPSGARPSGGFGGGMQSERLTAMAKSIATELNLDESKVLAALQEVMGSMRGGQGSGQPSSQPTS